jgi:nucleoside-diphosphate-sugar epimerase
MYGPGDDSSKFTTFIFESLKKNVPQIELTPGEQKRDFVYIDDVVEAYVVLLEKQKEKTEFSEFEIGSGEAVSIRDFVETAKDVIGAKTKLLFGARKYREHEIMFSQADIKKLQEYCGWDPHVPLNKGILKSL